MSSGAAANQNRIQAKRLHLTYAGLYRAELSHDTILTAAKSWGAKQGRLVEYNIGLEKHMEPAIPDRDEHFHVYVAFSRKVSIKNWRMTKVFDLSGREQRVLHPQVQAVGGTEGDRQRVIRYGMKDKVYIQSLTSPVIAADENDDDDDESDDEQGGWARMLNRAPTVRIGMQLLAEQYSTTYYLHGGRIAPMLQQRIGDGVATYFDLDDFDATPLELTAPVVLHGKSGTGKTEFALAHFDHPLTIRRRDDLKRITFSTDGLVFDDMSFEDWAVEDVICLLNWDKYRSLPSRYHDAQIPGDLPLIFTTNAAMTEEDTIFPRGRNAEQRVAIERRFIKVPVTHPLQAGGRPFTAEEMQARRMRPTATGTNYTPPPPPPAPNAAPQRPSRILPSDYDDSDDE